MNDSASMEIKIDTKGDDANELALQIVNYLRKQGFEPFYGELMYRDSHVTIIAKKQNIIIGSYRYNPTTDITLWTIPTLEKYPHEIKIQGFQDPNILRTVNKEMKDIIYYNESGPVHA